MIICNPRSLAFALLITALPIGFALAAGRGGGGLGAGVGAAGTGSAAVGGGASAGSVGGGPPAGRVGGGSPNSNDPAGNGSAGTGDPRANARGIPSSVPIESPELKNATTRGGFIGGAGVGAPPPSLLGGAAPAASSSQAKSSDKQSSDKPTAPKSGQSAPEEEAPFSPTGLSQPGSDGASTVIVAARGCGAAAHETDGTTTCIGIPDKSPKLSRTHR
jgi:hypothetical protein